MKHEHRIHLGRRLRNIGFVFPVAGMFFVTPLFLASMPRTTGSLMTILIVLTIFVLVGACLFLSGREMIESTRRGRCPQCDYDLQGKLQDGCPECGWRRRS